ncbi:hypothetical protein PPUJ20066_14150 [Pseudomonas putida]|nr:hypothetical protein PPUJ20066_14150 [Pseudomonas putida]
MNSGAAAYLWERACPAKRPVLTQRCTARIVSICRAPNWDARVSLLGFHKKTDPQWNAANDPDLFPAR